MSLAPLPPADSLDPLNFQVTPIAAQVAGRSGATTTIGHATGSFYRRGTADFLITNRHVVAKEEERNFPDELEITLHKPHAALDDLLRHRLPLYGDDRRPVWLEHPSFGAQVDVVAVPLPEPLRTLAFYTPFDAGSLPPADELLALGTPVVVAGYGHSFYDKATSLPVTRSGAIASAFGAPFRGDPVFLIDADLFPGSSGSPVVVPAKGFKRTKGGVKSEPTPPYLVGVHSGDYGAGGERLQLNRAWYADVLERIVEGGARGRINL